TLFVVVSVVVFFFRNNSDNKMSPSGQTSVINSQERDAFVNSIIKLNQARDLSNSLSSGKNTKSQKDVENEMFPLTQDAIDLSKQVSDDFLDSIHPELKAMYRDKLIAGSQMWLDGT